MLDNRTGLKCENCSSHIHKYKQDGVIIIECSHCGNSISNYDEAIYLVGDLYEDEDLQ